MLEKDSKVVINCLLSPILSLIAVPRNLWEMNISEIEENNTFMYD